MPKVFISYCHADGDFADIVRSRIQGAGFASWIDLEGLRPGEDWRQEIDQAIRDSVALITILTPAAADSRYVTYEWAFALGAEVKVIPIVLTPTEIHPRLSALQYLDFTRRETRPWPGLLEALEKAAKARPTQSIQLPRTAPAIVQQAVAALDSAEPQVMEQAMERLADMNLPEATDVLVEALKHPLPDVRISAAWHLAKRGDARAVPGLIEGNRQRRWHREFARVTAQVGPAAIPALLALGTDASPLIRRDFIWALEEIGDKSVLPEVIKLLGDTNHEVRGAAIRALWRLGTQEAVAAVEGALPQLTRDLYSVDTSVRQEAKGALEQIGSEKARAALTEWERAQGRPAPARGTDPGRSPGAKR